MQIFEGALNPQTLFEEWYSKHDRANYGAFLTFTGIVRLESGISALSFDIYMPMLRSWFDEWQKKADDIDAVIEMAHSKGAVPVHTSSFACAVLTPHRKAGLALLNDFVEDFKAAAPIWKYDIIGGERIYAIERSHPIEGSGLLA